MSEPAGGAQPTGDGATQAADQATGGSPFASVLEAVPEEHRDTVGAALKEIEGKITQRFQEAADFRKTWEQYEPLGLGEIGPEKVAEALTLAQLFADPSQANESIADRDRFIEAWEALGDAIGYFEPEGDGNQPGAGAAAQPGAEGDQPPAWVQPLIERLDAIEQRDQTREAEAVASAADKQVADELAALKEEHGEFDEPRVLQLAQAYALAGDPEAIAKGFADYQAILGGAERGLVERKAGHPDPAEPGGPAATTPEKPKDFKEARAIAARRLAATA